MSSEALHRVDRPSILLVDDDALILETVGSMLDYLGFQPVLAGTGEEALASLSAGLHPSLVILDMDMPGLGGGGTLPRIRLLHPTLPVVIATGRVTEAVVALTHVNARVGLMPKPFDLTELKHHLAWSGLRVAQPAAG